MGSGNDKGRQTTSEKKTERKKENGRVKNPVKQVANYRYSTTTRFQVRTPSACSSDICWMDSLHFCTSLASGEEASKDVGLLAVDANLLLCCSLACAARAPLLGRRHEWDNGWRISHADGECEAGEMMVRFSMID
ncbi:hypothetical protein Pdw03_2151 [Penicillium digitatum]|uniref:Uncharacterized protein n=1 Tax=Penicillium digitatum TaxID=36651 RepID=A0A7T6XTQ7_PENDI|nr:hypothetical protein Pdw03_2151 [Penicillium digitatum]